MTHEEIVAHIRALGIGYTVEGYVLVQELLAEHFPHYSSLQRKVIGAQLSNTAHFQKADA